MATDTTVAARPPKRLRRRVVLGTVAALLLIVAGLAARQYVRERRIAAVTERVARLGGSMKVRYRSPEWLESAVVRVPRLREIVGRPLAQINLRDTAVTAEDLRVVATFPDTFWVNLHGATGVDDDAVAALVAAPALESLGLSGPGVTDAGVRHFAGRLDPISVFLDGTAITDASEAVLRGLPKIGHIGLRSPGITAVVGKDTAAVGPAGDPVRAGGTFLVRGQVFARDRPASGSLRLTPWVRELGSADPQRARSAGALIVAVPAGGWYAYSIPAALRSTAPGPHEIDIIAQDDGPPEVSYRVARLTVEVLPAADPPKED